MEYCYFDHGDGLVVGTESSEWKVILGETFLFVFL